MHSTLGQAVDLKTYLKLHGFRFERDAENGESVWTNAITRVRVKRDYANEPGKLRVLKETVEAAFDRKNRREEEEKAKLEAIRQAQSRVAPPPAPTPMHIAKTPEQIRQDQILHARSMKDEDHTPAPPPPKPVETEAKEEKKDRAWQPKDARKHLIGRIYWMLDRDWKTGAIVNQLRLEGLKRHGEDVDGQYVSTVKYQRSLGAGQGKSKDAFNYIPIPPPTEGTPPPAPAETHERQRREHKKMSGEARLYFFGRIKHLMKQSLAPEKIAAMLRTERVKHPSGDPITTGYVIDTIKNFETHPERLDRYEEIAEPRRFEPREKTEAQVPVSVPTPPPPPAEPEPVMMALPAAPPRQEENRRLPRFVMKCLKDNEIPAEARIRMVLAWAEEEE